MDIKELLTKLSSGEVSQEHVESAVIDALEESKEGMVPRSRLNDKNQEIKDLQEQLDERDNQIETLKSSAEDDSEIQKQIQDLQNENANWSEKYSKSQLDSAIKIAVAKDANDPADVLALLDKDGLELDDKGDVKGLDDKLTSLRESKPYLFAEATKKTGRTPDEGDPPPATESWKEFLN